MKKFLLISILLSLSAASVQARVKCADFKDHAEAQRYFENRKHGYRSLDRDKDGEACECLRGGSSYGESICKRWRKKYHK